MIQPPSVSQAVEERLASDADSKQRAGAVLRDQIRELKRQFGQTSGPAKAVAEKASTSTVRYRKKGKGR